MQKFLRGQRVRLQNDPPKCMSHFEGWGGEAIVDHSFSDFHGGTGRGYALLLLGKRKKRDAWYEESQLTLVNADRDAGEQIIQEYNERGH